MRDTFVFIMFLNFTETATVVHTKDSNSSFPGVCQENVGNITQTDGR